MNGGKMTTEWLPHSNVVRLPLKGYFRPGAVLNATSNARLGLVNSPPVQWNAEFWSWTLEYHAGSHSTWRKKTAKSIAFSAADGMAKCCLETLTLCNKWYLGRFFWYAVLNGELLKPSLMGPPVIIVNAVYAIAYQPTHCSSPGNSIYCHSWNILQVLQRGERAHLFDIKGYVMFLLQLTSAKVGLNSFNKYSLPGYKSHKTNEILHYNMCIYLSDVDTA